MLLCYILELGNYAPNNRQNKNSTKWENKICIIQCKIQRMHQTIIMNLGCTIYVWAQACLASNHWLELNWFYRSNLCSYRRKLVGIGCHDNRRISDRALVSINSFIIQNDSWWHANLCRRILKLHSASGIIILCFAEKIKNLMHALVTFHSIIPGGWVDKHWHRDRVARGSIPAQGRYDYTSPKSG